MAKCSTHNTDLSTTGTCWACELDKHKPPEGWPTTIQAPALTVAAIPCPECERLRRERDDAILERHEALGVKTTEGLTASEWVLRTGKAERARDAALAERDEARKALENRRDPFTKGWEASVWTPLTKLLAEHGYVPGTGGNTYVAMLEKIIATAQARDEEVRSLRELLGSARETIVALRSRAAEYGAFSPERPSVSAYDSSLAATIARIDAELAKGQL